MDSQNIGLALNLLLALLSKASAISALVNQARAEGRDVTDEELALLGVRDDQARDALLEAIRKAKEGGT
jgi:DNA-nicking Smr family endonuclease